MYNMVVVPGGPVIDFSRPALKESKRTPEWVYFHKDEHEWHAMTMIGSEIYSTCAYENRSVARGLAWRGLMFPVTRWCKPISGPENPGA